ncbi:RimK family alpha-L-glutamate ligase [Oceanobacillus kapialis]|uniref:RimK family alpha-L-glutamate ligase n=1 Tax=Oceanobacillus kapialis TaxID=481353 RepID=A0ABW5PZJ6_9BACI
MINGWLIYNKQKARENDTYIRWFQTEASLQNISLSLLYREELTIGVENNQPIVKLKGETISFPDFAVVRVIDPLFSRHLEAGGIPVFNSSFISEIANDKTKTHLAIQHLGIPMLDSFFIRRKDTLALTPPMDYPFVLKDPKSSGGNQVFFIKDASMFKQRIQLIDSEYLLLQSCKVQIGKDIRVFVVGKNIIGAVLRKSDTDFRANYKLGGTAEIYPLSKNEKEFVTKIIASFDFDMVGIDFLLDENGQLLFNEIEDIVGSRTLSTVSDVNLLKLYVEHILHKINAHNRNEWSYK